MDLFKKKGENDRQFIFRLGRAKEQGIIDLDWKQLTEIFNKELTELKGPDDNLSVSTLQQQYRIAVLYYEDVFKDMNLSEEHIEQLNEIDLKTQEMYKQQVKMQDVAREYRSHLREDARIEKIVEAIKEDNCRFEPQIVPYVETYKGTNEAILMISDWHLGAIVQNFYNTFDLSVAEKRINKLFYKTVKYCKRHNVNKLHVVNLSDLLEGEIHATSRVESEMDTVQQIKQAVRLLCQLLINLSGEIEHITYRSVVDNHSRVLANFRDHIEKESFCKLIDWWLIDKLEMVNERFAQEGLLNCIEVVQDNIDDNIGYFVINDKNIFFSHGHQGSQSTVVQDLTFATNIVADIVLLGHWHVDKIKNFQGKKVYFNGSLKGVDSYTLGKRFFADPTQTLLIFDEDDVIDIPMQLK